MEGGGQEDQKGIFKQLQTLTNNDNKQEDQKKRKAEKEKVADRIIL